MNTDKISYFINHPESISASDVSTIKEVKIKFPYCSTLHMLYIKALAISNSIHFEEELKKSAIHVNDREKLHNLINQTTEKTAALSSKEPRTIEKPTITEKPEVKTQSIDQKEADSKQDNDTTPEVKITAPIVSKTPEKEVISTDLIKEVIEPIIEKPVEPTIKKEVKPVISEPKKEKVDMAKIIEDIRLKAEAARLKNKITAPEIKEPISTVPVEKEVVTEKAEPTEISKADKEEVVDIESVQDKTGDVTNSTPIIDPTVENKEVIKETTEVTEPLGLDVMAHAMEVAFELDVDNIIKNQTEADIEAEVLEDSMAEKTEEIESVDPNTLSFTDWLKYKQGKLKIKEEIVEPEKIKLSKVEIDDLLNKFIEEEPKMSRPQKEFYNPVKNAKKSLDDTTVLVSETLAKIYWMQKNYDKAIRAYEQLSLRNPEKKTFFANQIKKIKKEVK